MQTENRHLLEEYVRTGSEAAFRELVTRYVDFVYAAAVRMVNGDRHLAQDITQTVFTDLAQKARTLSPQVRLGGWLHRHTCFVASKTIRTERRRQARERLSVEMNAQSDNADPNLAQVAPLLDDAINQLATDDREAIFLRFFKNLDFRSIGQSLGTSEEAARKRVSRALDKLHLSLGKRGVALSAATVAAALAQGAAGVAPAGMAAAVSAKAIILGAAAQSSWALPSLLASTKVQAGVAVSMVLASAVTSVLIDHQSQARQRAAEIQLDARRAGLPQSNQPPQVPVSTGVTALNNRDELLRMRSEVASLRQQVAGLGTLQAENGRLSEELARARNQLLYPSQAPIPQTPEMSAKSLYCRDLAMALILYASDHQDQFPKDFSEATRYLSRVTSQTNFTPAQFEVVYQGSRAALTNYAHPGGILLLREKAAWKSADGRWVKGYAGTDGGGFLHSEPDGNFAAWEEKRIIGTSAP